MAFTGDIEAMFSRIRMNEADSKMHQFLWREGTKNVVFRMNRLPFGDGPSPCLAIAITRQVAEDYGSGKEEGKELIMRSLYVDDLTASRESKEEAKIAIEQAVEILKEADFNVRGWNTNETLLAQETGLDMQTSGEAKVLGMIWCLDDDTIRHQELKVPEMKFTKRSLLSVLAEVFSPLGLASPFLVSAKIKIKALHVYGLGWDSDLEELVAEEVENKLLRSDLEFWKNWLELRAQFHTIKFERCLVPLEAVQTELHTFCDASEEAYAAVSYLRCVDKDGRVSVRIVMAKTRVAPKKSISVAKLELNGALLGARLANTIKDILRLKVDRRIFWTDSSCTRSWVAATATFLMAFVANRVGEIQTLTTPEEWRFCRGKLNVADVATRSNLAESMDKLREIFELWKTGPAFLQSIDESTWPTDIRPGPPREELRPKYDFMSFVTEGACERIIAWERTSDFRRLQRALARVIIRLKRGAVTEITVEAMEKAEEFIVKQAQKESFEMEIQAVKEGQGKKSKLLSLTPFIDDFGVLRVGGRVGKTNLPFDAKHPIILSSKHRLSRLIVEKLHQENFHCGTSHLLSIVQEKFWIVHGRELCKRVGQDCFYCKRRRARPMSQIMADLPLMRFDPIAPFKNVSIDLFGPFKVRLGTTTMKTRSTREEKRWGVIYTCLHSRAVHLDVVESLSTPHFLSALRAFEGLRGTPSLIFSDNGLNFVGAEKELSPVLEQVHKEISANLTLRGIKWLRYPPKAPHWGGVHEALVKSVKKALMSELDKWPRLLNDIEIRVLFDEIIGFMNTRPLTYTSSDAEDFQPLRPCDFLSPGAIFDVHPGTDNCAVNQRNAYKRLQALVDIIWRRWTAEYIPTLMTRAKWQHEERDAEVGDAVLLLEENLPRGKWKIGRITQVNRGSQDKVRSVMVKTSKGEYKRPITRCCLIERAEDYPQVKLPEHLVEKMKEWRRLRELSKTKK